MNQTRTLALIALLFLGWMLFTAWQQDYAPAPPPASTAPTTSTAAPAGTTAAQVTAGELPSAGQAAPGSVPSAPSQQTAPAPGQASVLPEESATASQHGQLIQVQTDLLQLAIDTRGASIVSARLKAYPVSLDSSEPVRLLNHTPENFYVAQSGLVSATSPAPNHKAAFTTAADSYALAQGQDRLQVSFRWQGSDGIEVVKTYTFTRGSYVIDLEQTVINHGGQAWVGSAYRQLQRVTPPEPEDQHLFGFSDPSQYSFTGAAWYSPAEGFAELAFDDFKDEPLNVKVTGGWIAQLQHYFFSAWIPPKDAANRFASAVIEGGPKPRYLIRAIGPAFTVQPGANGSEQARLFIGPKLPEMLESIAPEFGLAVDYGFLTPISVPLHWTLSKFEAITGNWGFAIILLVLLIKAIFFKLSEAQYRSMAKMRKLQPKVKALKQRFGDDKQKQQQAMMELYKKEKANPMAGCLPMIVQIPIFIALYYMLMQSVELRQEPFILWINDLSAPDPYFVLPVIYGLLMLGQQFLTPAQGMDPTQAKIMKFMPVGFAFFFAFFPSGLVLYYCVNTLISVLQMWFIMHRFEAREKARAA